MKMTAYQETIFERKQMAIGAKKRKCGRKSTKCGLPSDYMTKKEKEKMNGEVKCYNVLMPWTWQEFKEAPNDICQEYLDRLAAVYNVNNAMLAMMFGKGRSTVRKHFIDRGLKFSSPSGMPTKETKDAWATFIFREKKGKEILAELAGGSPNDTTDQLTTKLICGNSRSDASVTDFKGGTRPAKENRTATQETAVEGATGLAEGSGGLLETDISVGMSGAFDEAGFLEKIKRILPSDGEMVAIRIDIKTLKT